jgi:hypothetical protein
MNENTRQALLMFIKLYKVVNDKEAFISMWEQILNTPDTVLTLADAYDAAYGSALDQIISE